MSQKELIDSLRARGEQKAWEIWHLAEAAAANIQAEASREIEGEKTRLRIEKARRVEERSRARTLEAEREARGKRVAAKNRLAERLYCIARESLARFREGDYEALFCSLANELPAVRWQRVLVNPADQVLARKVFPAAEVIADPDIAGGMRAVGEGALISVDNTLGKRLERAWDFILPGLLQEVIGEVSP